MANDNNETTPPKSGATPPPKPPVHNSSQKRCFIVSPIGGDGTDIRKRSDQIKKHIVDEVLAPLNYKSIRADSIEQSGNITTQIVNELISADLVIADLTGHNANVFYELAIRHAFAKPYIQIIEQGEKIPFDVTTYRTISIDHKDLDSAASARDSIREMILKIEEDLRAGKAVETPVQHAVNRQELGKSSNPEKQELAQISENMDMLRSEMSLMARMVRSGSVASEAMSAQLLVLRDVISSLSREGRLAPEYYRVLRKAVSSPRSEFAKWVESLDEAPF